MTIVTTCKGRLEHLQQTLASMVSQGIPCIVVDYGCPQGTGQWVAQNHPSVRVVQADGVANFNIGRARNLGSRQVRTPWVCFLDSDKLLGPDFAQNTLPLLRNGAYFLAHSEMPDLSGMVVCAMRDFAAIEGYDEVFEGWGCEDNDLYARLERHGCVAGRLPKGVAGCIAHADDVRTQFHALKDRFVSLRVNAMYLQVKADLAAQMRVPQLPLLQRQGLYAEVRRIVLETPGKAAHLEITLPLSTEYVAPPGWQLTRRMNYSLSPTATATTNE